MCGFLPRSKAIRREVLSKLKVHVISCNSFHKRNVGRSVGVAIGEFSITSRSWDPRGSFTILRLTFHVHDIGNVAALNSASLVKKCENMKSFLLILGYFIGPSGEDIWGADWVCFFAIDRFILARLSSFSIRQNRKLIQGKTMQLG